MKKKNLFWLMVFSLLPGPAHCDVSVQNHPALKLMRLYAGEIKHARHVVPYIVNIIAVYEVNHRRRGADVQNYIDWYCSRLNYPDRKGLTGTIYDYDIATDGQENPLYRYDSVDGYAGTFLYLLNSYLTLTDDEATIRRHWSKIKDIAYLIHHLQASDGLTVALPSDPAHRKYLMDNCEAYAGLLAFKRMAERTGRREDWIYAKTMAAIQRAVLSILYDPGRDNFFWAVDDWVKHASDWSVFYPDALAQLFPIYFDLLDGDRKQRLWRAFNRRYSDAAGRLPLEQRMLYTLTKEKMHPSGRTRPEPFGPGFRTNFADSEMQR